MTQEAGTYFATYSNDMPSRPLATMHTVLPFATSLTTTKMSSSGQSFDRYGSLNVERNEGALKSVTRSSNPRRKHALYADPINKS